MPCRSYDDDNPLDRKARENAHVAKLYCWARYALNKKISEKLLEDGKRSFLEKDYTEDLCALLRKVTDATDKYTLFSQNSPTSAELNLWWVRHQEFDKTRKLLEETKAAKNELRKQALTKLTPEERKALDLD